MHKSEAQAQPSSLFGFETQAKYFQVLNVAEHPEPIDINHEIAILEELLDKRQRTYQDVSLEQCLHRQFALVKTFQQKRKP